MQRRPKFARIDSMKKICLLLLIWVPSAFAADAANGKKLFVSRACNACHSVGSEGTAQTGPNLAGVLQRRQTPWVKKWLKNPDAMRNDPVIKQMDSKYHSSMPNLALSDSEVDDLLAYLGASVEKSKSK